jgi:prepilin signal peptidase PulO-like enzyme (type II secretory pathway)
LSGLFYLLFQLSKGTWIGGGDVKLAIALGLIAGDPLRAMLILFMASLVGTLAALPTLIKNKNKRGIKLPFGPLLIAGTIIVQLFGADMIAWYTSLLSV